MANKAGRQAGGSDIQPLVATLDAQIATVSARLQADKVQLGKLRKARTLLAGDGVLEDSPPARRQPIAPGTIEDRVLSIVREGSEPLGMKDILAGEHGAPDHLVKTVVAKLVKARRLTATGATSTRRYSVKG